MKRVMLATSNKLMNLKALVEEQLRIATQPYSAAIDTANAQLRFASVEFNQASRAFDAAQRELLQLKDTQSKVSVDMSETLAKAEAAVDEAKNSLERTGQQLMEAQGAYNVACAPIQNWMDVLTLVASVARSCSDEEYVAMARLDEYAKDEERRINAIENERYVCQTCKGKGGYCRDCDITR